MNMSANVLLIENKELLATSCTLHVVMSQVIGSLSKPRRRRQRERHQTKRLMSKTMVVRVRYKSWYISLRSSAKQKREMTKWNATDEA